MRLLLVCASSETGFLMARSLRSPAALMTAYVLLFVWGGPWLGSAGSASRNAPQIAIAVVLAIFAATGSRSARVVMITYSMVGVLAVFSGTTHSGVSKPLGTFLPALACALAQIGLLVSTPMYQRTRPGWTRGAVQPYPFLPWPKLWSVLAGAAGGLGLALVPFSDGLRETVCSAGGRPPSPCPAAGFGYPIAYRYAWDNLAPRGINFAAFATDWALWGLSILLVLYLVQLNRSREYAHLDARPPAEPVPGHP
jgi:hypothetical protein